MEPFLRENLERAEALLAGRPIHDPLLAWLWTEAWRAANDAEDLEVLPLAADPQRTVLRLRPRVRESGAGDPMDWVLQLEHGRSGRALAGWMKPGGIRALATAAGICPWHPDVHAERPAPGVGILARPWRRGTPLAHADPQQAEAVGRGLAHLHRNGWTAASWTCGDLLVRGTGPDRTAVEILPLVGGARRGGDPIGRLRRRADLVRVLACWAPDEAARAAPSLLEGNGSRDWNAKELCAAAGPCRARRFLRESADCLRAGALFEAWGATGWRRRRTATGEEEPPELLGTSAGGLVERRGSTVWKTYLRPGPLGALRRLGGQGPGRRAYRMFRLLERMRLAAARPIAWRREGETEQLVCDWVGGRPAEPNDLPSMAVWLAGLHLHGLGLRDAKCANFRVRGGQPVLIDADGVRGGPERRPRDLGRLLAESSAERWPRLVRTYEQAARPLSPEERRATAAAARRFRRILESRT